MPLFILKPEKLSVLVEKTRLYHLVSVSAAGSYQSKNGIQWNCPDNFPGCSCDTRQTGRGEPITSKKWKDEKHNGEVVSSLIYVIIIQLKMTAIINNLKWTDWRNTLLNQLNYLSLPKRKSPSRKYICTKEGISSQKMTISISNLQP